MPYHYQLTNISVTQNAIADWLIANPGKGQNAECASAFNITQSWLSTLLGTDAFRAMMLIKQGAVFEEVVIPLREKISGVAHRSIEKMGEILDNTNDERLVREIGKDMLNSLGYGANAKGPVHIGDVHNTLTVSPENLAAARERQSKHYRRELESPAESEPLALEAEATELPYDPEADVGEARDIRASHVNRSKEVHRDTEEGGEVRSESPASPELDLW